jgi:predicted acetyltransferase
VPLPLMRQADAVPPEIRPLTRDDAEAADALAAESFGAPPRALPEPWPVPETCPWGAFVGGELAGVATVRAFRSWFGGEPVPMAGIASVAVRPEHRGAGLLAPLVAALLTDARERGAVVSGLYPTAPGIYRRLGYEIVGELADVEVPVASLARIPVPPGITLRRGDPGDERDVTAHRELYEWWARAQNGPLTREGALHRPLDGRDTVTLALEGETVTGYAAWSRTEGYGGAATVTVHELIALTGPATAALWRLFGSFASLAGTVRLRTSGADVTRHVLPASPWRPVRQWPYCLRLLDVAGAFQARGVAPIDATLPFTVTGDGLDGAYRLTARDGAVTCEAGTGDGPVFTGRGLALAYAGVQSCANLRFAGLLSGPDTDDARWDALLGGRPFHIRNYF